MFVCTLHTNVCANKFIFYIGLLTNLNFTNKRIQRTTTITEKKTTKYT